MPEQFSQPPDRSCINFVNCVADSKSVKIRGKIYQTLSVKSTQYAEISQTRFAKSAKRFALSWSRCVTLLTIDGLEERRIYEIGAADNSGTY